MAIKRIDGLFKPGHGRGIETKRGVGAEFGSDLGGAGRAAGTAKDVVNPAALLAAIAEPHDHLSLEAVGECGRG
jgi:hypothetical protein